MKVKILIVCLLFSISTSRVYAHDAVHKQIEAVTQQILQQPDNVDLYIKRGELQRLHRNWEAALTDFEYAAKISTTQSSVDFYIGQVYLDSGQYELAKNKFNLFLQAHPEHIKARVARARTLVSLGQGTAAAVDYSHVISRLKAPQPEYYLERAQALGGAGPEYIDQAIKGLDEGIHVLGPLLILQLGAIDLELSRGRFEAALVRLDRVIEQMPRKEKWLAKKAEILLMANRPEEARKAWEEALRELEKLPPGRRNVRATKQLEAEVRAGLGKHY